METVKHVIEAPKEGYEVALLIAKVIEDAKSGKNVQEIALGSLSELSAALQGLDKLPAEAKAAPIDLGFASGHLIAKALT